MSAQQSVVAQLKSGSQQDRDRDRARPPLSVSVSVSQSWIPRRFIQATVLTAER